MRASKKSPALLIALIAAMILGVPLITSADTLQVMSLQDYYRIIIARHPVVKQSTLLSEDAKAQIRMAKGMLDPTANVSYQNKVLTGTEYYQLWDNTLKIPVWFGTDFKIGYEQNTGQSVNAQDATTSAGLIYAGVSVPLGQGLFIDERRNTIRQAQLMPQLAEAERISVVNGVLLKATSDYWDWFMARQRYLLLDSAYKLAAQRFVAVKERALLGDLPAIDTVEAWIAVQDRDVLRLQALLDYKNAMLNASVHLWGENEVPMELTENIIPTDQGMLQIRLTKLQLDSLQMQARNNHPDLLKIGVKQRQLMFEERYQRDKLKPKLNLQYNLITKDPGSLTGPAPGAFYSNNYKFGVYFSYPLLLRKERGKIQQVEIKQSQLEFERQQKEREIVNSINIQHNNSVMLGQQIAAQKQQVTFSRVLRDAEQTRFFAGESSFFLVNTREMALINSEIRLYELQVRYAKATAQLYWASGTLLAQ
jgi:outer membrane protein TolC